MISYLKKEKVLSISLVLAAISAFFVRPDAGYLAYMDLRVLALLFGLMLIVKGFQEMGLFDLLIRKLFAHTANSRRLNQMLILVCFFSSMLITNDVALITFVPFAISALRMCGQTKQMIPVVVLQTIAANLGSMFTPIGNPQNLYLFTASGMPVGTFILTMLPLTAVSLVLLMLVTLKFPADPIRVAISGEMPKLSRKDMAGYSLLFIVNLLVVFRVLNWIPALVITVAGVLLMKKQQLLPKVDYALLLTFVGFFIFVGNLGRIPQISQLIAQVVQGREVLVSALFSQVLSNVPAALLLSGFTDNFTGLLIGVNVGGLGTLIASMASLISYKLYAQETDAQKGRYMLEFTAYNLVGLLLLLIFCAVTGMH